VFIFQTTSGELPIILYESRFDSTFLCLFVFVFCLFVFVCLFVFCEILFCCVQASSLVSSPTL